MQIRILYKARMNSRSTNYTFSRRAGKRPCAFRKGVPAISKRDHKCRSAQPKTCSSDKTRPSNACATTNFERCYQSGQQYSVIALTDQNGNVKERYSYTAYGELGIYDSGGTARSSSNLNNRFTYTGREWDEDVVLYHYRARVYLPRLGRFGSRDPIGYEDGWNLMEYVKGGPLTFLDPTGRFLATMPPGLKKLRKILFDLCEKCTKDGPINRNSQQQACKNRARRIYKNIAYTWMTAHGHGPLLNVEIAPGGYMCYEWANAFHTVGQECGGKEITSQTIVITQIGGPLPHQDHAFTRFCAGSDRSKKECCVDVDDGFFDGSYCHTPGSMEDDTNWELVPDEEAQEGTPIPVIIR